jgi:hypothetical protein
MGEERNKAGFWWLGLGLELGLGLGLGFAATRSKGGWNG